MSDVNVSSTEFAAYQADVDERMSNILLKIDVLDSKIDSVLDTQEVVEFPDEQAQIREKVMTAFQQEISQLVTDMNELKTNVAALQEFHD